MSKSNVESMVVYAENSGYYKSDKCEEIVAFHNQPHAIIIQTHIKNLQSEYTNEQIMEVIELLGINKINLKKGA